MKIRKIICLLFIILAFLQAESLAIEEDELFNPVEIKDGMNLSISDCVGAAFKNSPKIRRQKYNLDIAKSNLGIARAQYFPVISVGAGFFHENNSDRNNYYSNYRQLPAVGVTVNKLVWDFGKTTAYIKMEEFYKIGAEYEFMDSLCSTLFEVKLKYYNLLREKAKLDIAKNNFKINKHFVEISHGEPDLLSAQMYFSNSKIKLIEAENNFKNAKINLNNSMYLESQPNYTIKDTQTFSYENDLAYNEKQGKTEVFTPVTFNFPIEKAVEIAYENSPDLNVLISTKNAMEQSLKFIKKTYMPDLTANAGYGLNNSTISTNNSFQVGVNLNSSVNLMELKHSIKGADAQVNLANNEIELFKKDLFFEVKRSFNNVEKAQKQVPIAKLEATQALQNLKLVEEKYKIFELDYTALQDAKEDYIIALTDYIDTLYNYNIALIQVEMAMHYHIVDIHHRSKHAMHFHSDELIEHLNKVLGCDKKEHKKEL